MSKPKAITGSSKNELPPIGAFIEILKEEVDRFLSGRQYGAVVIALLRIAERTEFEGVDDVMSVEEALLSIRVKLSRQDSGNILSGLDGALEAVQSQVGTACIRELPCILRAARVASSHYQVGIHGMRSKRRSRVISNARHLAMYLARTTSDLSIAEIGRFFGARDHSTVLYGINKVEKKMCSDEKFAAQVRHFVQRLKNED